MTARKPFALAVGLLLAAVLRVHAQDVAPEAVPALVPEAAPAPASPTGVPQEPTTTEVPAPFALPTEQPATPIEQPTPAPVIIVEPVQPPPPAPIPAPAPVTAPAPTQDAAIATPAEDEDALPWALLHRRFSTRDGSSGGLTIEEPGSGAVGALRLQLALDVAPPDDFAIANNETGRTDKTLSVSWTALEMLEIFAALRDRNTTQSQPVASSIYAQGALIGFKLFAPIGRIFNAGGSLRFAMQNELGSATPLLKATSIGVRAAGSADLRQTGLRIPLITRLNLEYLFDNSAAVIEDTENARYEALGNTAARRNETRHLISRTERYALDINRVDRLTIGLGLEAPLVIGEDATLHPLLEWHMAIPINRQAFDCAVVRGVRNDGRSSTADSCLGTSGTDAWPANLTLGIRLVPPVRGLSLLFALDLGLAGSSVFVRELAPTAPFALTFALGYDYDAR